MLLRVKGFRPQSIDPTKVSGQREAKYAITPSPLQFTINGQPYEPSAPLVLNQEAVEEWKVWSDPDPKTAIPVAHPSLTCALY